MSEIFVKFKPNSFIDLKVI